MIADLVVVDYFVVAVVADCLPVLLVVVHLLAGVVGVDLLVVLLGQGGFAELGQG